MTTVPADIANTVFDALETSGVDPTLITRDATFAELDVDSLDLAELLQIIDDTYEVVLTVDDLKAIKNVGDVLDLVAERA